MTDRITEEKRAYLQASEEVDDEEQDKGLWIKALAQSQGVEDKARHRYVLLRVDDILSNDESPVHCLNEEPVMRGLTSRLFTPENKHWLYCLVIVITSVSGLSPLFLKGTDIFASSLFPVGALIAGVRFLVSSERVRFTICLALAGLCNPFLLSEIRFDDVLLGLVALGCPILLILLHAKKKQYRLFRNLCLGLYGISLGVVVAVCIYEESPPPDDVIAYFLKKNCRNFRATELPILFHYAVRSLFVKRCKTTYVCY